MSTAKCFRCHALAEADTFEQARKKLDHSIGLGRGIKCGDSYGGVREIGGVSSSSQKTKTIPAKKEEPEKVFEETPQEKPKKERKTKKTKNFELIKE